MVAKAERPNREMLVTTVAVLCFTFRGLSNYAFTFVPSSVGRTSMKFYNTNNKKLVCVALLGRIKVLGNKASSKREKYRTIMEIFLFYHQFNFQVAYQLS